MKSIPVPYCGGNSPGADSIPTTRSTTRTGLPAAPSSTSGRASPTRSCGDACVTVNETSTSSGLPTAGRRPASSFRRHIVPGTAPFSGATSVADAGWSTVYASTGAALVTCGSRLTSATGTLAYDAPMLEPDPVPTLTKSSGARLQATSAG